ncbi:MAG: outer membrane protein assembly factor BamA [Proteobacteria bacterium]|nr:outer membrane protein assembly factor BamA [Pseudomonadota bacterium]
MAICAFKKIKAIRLGVLLLTWLCAWDALADQALPMPPVKEIAQINVHVTGGGGKTQELEALARNLIVLKAGGPFETGLFEASLASLKRSGLFEEIHAPDPDFSAPVLTFDVYLKAFQRIRDVRIHNAFPLMEKKVKSAMKLFAGDSFMAQTVREKEERLKALYRKSGYPNPQVTITADESTEGDGVVISVGVEKGDFYHISYFDIRGNESFFGIRLKLRTNSYKASLMRGDGQRFIQEKLDEDVKNIARFYRDRGYPDVIVSSDIEILESRKKVRIYITVMEGPKYVIRFEGNREFWGRTLKKEIDLSRRGNAKDMGLKRGARNIRERYRKAGYPNAYVGMGSETTFIDGKEQRLVIFSIDEGPRSLVQTLSFEGNDHMTDRQLKKQVLTSPRGLLVNGAYVPEILNDDLSAMKSLYKKNGFANPTIESSVIWEKDDQKNNWAHVTVHVNEGLKTEVSSLNFQGLTALSQKEAKPFVGLQEGKPFSESQMKDDEKVLSSAISEKGYPRVIVTGKATVHDDLKTADVTYYVDQGEYTAMGKVILLGNFRTKDKVINSELEVGEGDPFSLAKFLESQRNIRNINALSGVGFKEFGLLEKSDTVDLVVEAEEKKPYYIQAAVGYDTSKHGYLNTRLGDRNLFGLNKDAWVTGEYSEIGYRAESGVTEPRFLGTRISSTLNVFSEKLEELNKDFGTRTMGTSVHFSRDFFRYFNTALSFTYEYRDQYQRDADAIPQEEMEFYKGRRMVVTSPSLSYNSTDSFIRPRKGIYSSVSLDLSKALGEAPDEFLKYNVQAHYYYSPLSFLTLAFRCRYGYIQPRGDSPLIPDDQLFFLGGTADVRGFDENLLRYDLSGDPVGGRELIMGGLEVRTDLGRNVELATFFDTGRIGKTDLDQGRGLFRSSVGAGLRYITPIGPVGFLYGFKLSPEKNEKIGQFHFSIGYSF